MFNFPPELRDTLDMEEYTIVLLSAICEKLQITDVDLIRHVSAYLLLRDDQNDKIE